MNQRVSAILMIALLVSGGATFLVYRLLAQRSSDGAAPHSIAVVRAARTLQIGTLLHDDDLTRGPWVGELSPGMTTKKEGLIGRGVVATIYSGEPIMDSRLAAVGAGAGLAATIPPGMRAVAVRVNDIVGVAGFVLPGMRVDVLITGAPPNAPPSNGPQVKTALQNIEVLSAGQNYQKDTAGKPDVVTVVNLLVNPEQAETLSLASNETRIQLVLRNPLDTQAAKTPGISVAGLFGGSIPPPSTPAVHRVARLSPPTRPLVLVAAKPEPPAPLPILQIEVFNGSQRSEAKFTAPHGAGK